MSTSDATTDRILALACERFDRPPGSLSAEDDLFQSLGIDSMQALDLMTRLEETFDVEIPDYELQGVSTFADLAALVRRRQ
ncbi:MAG: acyl carrier protein [Deltaproteobacteria bacterium]|nr:acyl carrier protein [Deltaproteobacteria bacterium]